MEWLDYDVRASIGDLNVDSDSKHILCFKFAVHHRFLFIVFHSALI